jgi:hypothetical protein
MLREEKEDDSASRKLCLAFILLKLTLAGSLHVRVDQPKNKLPPRMNYESRDSSTTCGKDFPRIVLREEKGYDSASRKLSLAFIPLKLTLAGSLHACVD